MARGGDGSSGPSVGVIFRVAGAVLCLLALPALAESKNVLRLVPPEMDPAATIETIAAKQLPVGAIVIDVCRAGQTLFPVPDSPFEVREGFQGGGPLKGWIALAHANGLRVYAGFSPWFWWPPMSRDPDPFLKHPTLLELNSDLSCDPGAAGKYASPWSEEVRKGLRNLAAELGRRYPELDGLYLHPTLALTTWLGFSDAARVAYIRAAQVDPIDVPVYGVAESKDPRLMAWYAWRLDSIAECVDEISRAYREACGDARKPVLARALASTPTWRIRFRTPTCADWARWISRESVSAMVLEADLARGNGFDEFAAGYRVYRDFALATGAYLLVPGEQYGQIVPFEETWKRLMGAKPPPIPLLVDPATPEALASALELLASAPP